jgi:hypothetical protein
MNEAAATEEKNAAAEPKKVHRIISRYMSELAHKANASMRGTKMAKERSDAANQAKAKKRRERLAAERAAKP